MIQPGLKTFIGFTVRLRFSETMTKESVRLVSDLLVLMLAVSSTSKLALSALFPPEKHFFYCFLSEKYKWIVDYYKIMRFKINGLLTID